MDETTEEKTGNICLTNGLTRCQEKKIEQESEYFDLFSVKSEKKTVNLLSTERACVCRWYLMPSEMEKGKENKAINIIYRLNFPYTEKKNQHNKMNKKGEEKLLFLSFSMLRQLPKKSLVSSFLGLKNVQ